MRYGEEHLELTWTRSRRGLGRRLRLTKDLLTMGLNKYVHIGVQGMATANMQKDASSTTRALKVVVSRPGMEDAKEKAKGKEKERGEAEEKAKAVEEETGIKIEQPLLCKRKG